MRASILVFSPMNPFHKRVMLRISNPLSACWNIRRRSPTMLTSWSELLECVRFSAHWGNWKEKCNRYSDHSSLHSLRLSRVAVCQQSNALNDKDHEYTCNICSELNNDIRSFTDPFPRIPQTLPLRYKSGIQNECSLIDRSHPFSQRCL